MRRAFLIVFAWSSLAFAQADKTLEKADAEYKAQHWSEAYEAYDDARKTYTLAPPKKAQVDARIRELEAKVALVTIKTNEPGASVTIDGQMIGATPITKRLSAGKHEIVVEKPGFEVVRRSEDVRGGARATLDVVLAQAITQGRVSIKEREGRRVHVFVDGKDVGLAPWEGELDPGSHEVILRGDGISANASIEVARGQRTNLELSASSEQGSVQIQTSDGEGDIFIDGKRIATGAFRGTLAPGKHELVVSREGFQTVRETIEVTRDASLTKTIALVRVQSNASAEASEPFGGFYGGWMIFGAFQAGGTGSGFENGCALFGGTSCSAPSPVGAGIGGSIGYTWDPIGLEIFGAGMADYAEPEARFDGVLRAGSNPALTGPARVEKWRVMRYGGMGALRIRGTWDTRILRASLAIGPGFSFKSYVADRRMTSNDNQSTDTFAPDQVQVASAALSIEAAVHLRASRKVAFTAGLMFWFESAGSAVMTNADPNRVIGSAMGPLPLRTPPYKLAQGTQTYVGPFLGMTFGP